MLIIPIQFFTLQCTYVSLCPNVIKTIISFNNYFFCLNSINLVYEYSTFIRLIFYLSSLLSLL